MRPVPFHDAAEAWFWTLDALAARQEGRGGGGGGIPRPCVPDDVVACLDRLYRRHAIGPAHARVLRDWGRAHMAPRPGRRGEDGAARLWAGALDQLAAPLREKGIIA